jgi:5-carboxymethyl-2-hydroxymuconate isomerase
LACDQGLPTRFLHCALQINKGRRGAQTQRAGHGKGLQS